MEIYKRVLPVLGVFGLLVCLGLRDNSSNESYVLSDGLILKQDAAVETNAAQVALNEDLTPAPALAEEETPSLEEDGSAVESDSIAYTVQKLGEKKKPKMLLAEE